MLTALVLFNNLKWAIPTTLLLGSMPAFLSVGFLWKILSAPFPSWVYVAGDDLIFSSYHAHVLFYFEIVSGVEVLFYGDSDYLQNPGKKENCIYMSNHQSTADWLFGGSVSYRCGVLGRTRHIIKDGLKFVPWYGIYLIWHGSVLVKRAKRFNKEKANKQLQRNAEEKKPMWLIIFPEGTRFNPALPDTINASKQFAETQDLVPLENVLFPRNKAIQMCMEHLKESMDSVFDVTIAYGKTIHFETKKRLTAPNMHDVLQGLPRSIHIHMKRIPIEQVPQEEVKLKHWLYERFQEKDRLLSGFYHAESENDVKFEGPSRILPLSLKSVLPSVVLWSGSFMAIIAFKESRDLYIKVGIGTAALGVIWAAIKG